MAVMTDEKNPYQSPLDEAKPVGSLEIPRSHLFGRVFRYSCGTSLAVAIVVPIFLMVLLWAKPIDVLEVAFVFLSTAPSVFTCLIFSVCYCHAVRSREDCKIWPAVLFGVFSALIFNAVTAITVIEHFFSW